MAKKKAIQKKTHSKSKEKKQVKVRKSRPIVQKEHPWRVCPIDQHWVSPHVKHRKPSKKHPDGVTPYRGFCRENPSHKSSIYTDELTFMADRYFDGLGKSLPEDPDFKGKEQFDDLIVGWTKYWNDILKPKKLLEPELVKALIATESGFRPGVIVDAGKREGKARGLLQVTDEAQRIMNSSDSEIKNYLVHIDQEEMTYPDLNIAAGVRWLFHKKALTESTLKRKISWYETIVFYKGYGSDYLNGKTIHQMNGAEKIIDAYKRIAGKDLKR